MYQRAALVGGQVLINSSSETGTLILAQLPLQEFARHRQPIAQSIIVNSLSRGQVPAVPAGNQLETTILIVIEQPLQRQGLNRLLSGYAQLQIVAEVKKLDEAGDAAKKYQPNVIIVNPVAAEGKKQQEVLSSITAAAPEARILVISSRIDPEYVINALENGALGYIPLNATMTDLTTAISNVARGQVYLSPVIKEWEVLAKLAPTNQ